MNHNPRTAPSRIGDAVIIVVLILAVFLVLAECVDKVGGVL